MAMEGETISSGAPTTCEDCGVTVEVKPQKWSPAGYAVCSFCDCGPYSRESGYYPSMEALMKAIADGEVEWRTTEFNGGELTVKPVGYEAVCLSCGETFNPNDAHDLIHTEKENGETCGGLGVMGGSWS